jgi:hypothetical protein
MTEKMENISRSALYRESASSLEDQYIQGGYTYNADKGVWEAPKTYTPRAVTTEPETPIVGDIWYDSSTGSQYVYYTDTTKSQWIQVGGSASGA